MKPNQIILSEIVKDIVLKISNYSEEQLDIMGLGELVDLLRMQSTDIYDLFNDFYLSLESLNFIRTDNQLQQNASHFWKEQMEVFNQRIESQANDLIEACKEKDIQIEENIKSLLKY